MLSQIIRFTLPPYLTISALEFLKLRQKVAAAGAVAQYYGYTLPTRKSPLPKKRHEICWAIHWPDLCDRRAVMTDLRSITTGDETSLLFKFTDTQLPELEKGLEAPICEFACIRLADDAPLSDTALQRSMIKTYTDTYKMLGFTGGNWGYSMNANESAGVPLRPASEDPISEGERRLGVYFLGWESIELHQDATETSAFAEEIDKLMPYFGNGTGAWYVSFKKY
ncbi:hypothetical protein B0J13DRAFT_541119 [Dactylonectria estremocensis]|uniref:Uncharacterized protein n=1 Tax=Dactylonectria estremocensis TaxID=1079267 RepID=A0A9P9FEM5_9HYPO|nr:hypothetical protein B0J13DRAFT_541119 [Dactylonectria estremocensis]